MTASEPSIRIAKGENEPAAPAGEAVILVASSAWMEATDWRALGYVAVVEQARMAVDLPIAIADWSPSARIAEFDRLVAMFGAAAGKLVDGLARLLEEALEVLHQDERLAVAHRVAGLAGTLGFAALGREWLRAAEGHQPSADYLHRITAHALATIAQVRGR